MKRMQVLNCGIGYPTIVKSQTVIESARKIVSDLHDIGLNAQDSVLESQLWESISSKVEQKEVRSIRMYWKWAAAAVIFLIAGFAAIRMITYSQDQLIEQTYSKEGWVNQSNNTGKVKEIELPDRSVVLLEPFSTLKYQIPFTDNERHVFLRGEAFFRIQRDTLRPFLVYANETITKVLGTSFSVKAYEGEENVGGRSENREGCCLCEGGF